MAIIQGFFSEQICEIRKQSLKSRKKRDPNKVIASWIEKDRLINRTGDALVVILNSSGCSWSLSESGGCSMCGYSNDTIKEVTAENLINQIKGVINSESKIQKKKIESVKLFNSGSFLDQKEIPITAQDEISGSEWSARRP